MIDTRTDATKKREEEERLREEMMKKEEDDKSKQIKREHYDEDMDLTIEKVVTSEQKRDSQLLSHA